MYDKNKALDWMKRNLSEKRLKHSLNTMKAAEELADRFGADREKASYAGLLHDCAKNLSNDDIFYYCSQYGIEVDDICRLRPTLLHGIVGANIVRREFGIPDEDIYNAISYHTTGRKNMSMLEKIIYIADLIEDNRSFSGVDELRAAAKENLDAAVLKAIQLSIDRVINRKEVIHSNSIDAWNDIIKKQER